MKDDVFEHYRNAGQHCVKDPAGRRTADPGRASYLEVVESIEGRVTEEGAALAFPLNLSLNEDAAHDTASYSDTRVFAKGDVAKLDLGVQVEGYIADTATTVDLGNNSLLVDASREALEAAISAIVPVRLQVTSVRQSNTRSRAGGTGRLRTLRPWPRPLCAAPLPHDPEYQY